MRKETIRNSDIQQLATLRDEFKVKAHLFTSELKQRWGEIEKDWQTLRAEGKQIKPVAAKAAARVMRSSKPLLAKIESSLLRIQEEVRRHHKAG